MTKIEWTEATWNPIVGCTIATPGCTNCYAMRAAWRMSHNPATPQYHGTVKMVNGNPVWTGKMALVEKVLAAPLHRKKPTTYFVNSMGDLFHEDVPDEWIDRVFAVMALCPQHRFQILTKRSARMREYVAADRRDEMNAIAGTLAAWSDMDEHVSWPLNNVWLGVSVEDQRRADERIPDLLSTPAAIRFVSAEPLLGPVNLTRTNSENEVMINALTGEGGWPVPHVVGGPALDWVIGGGESGRGARPMHPDWARDIRDQCVAAGVPQFFKQWGAWLPSSHAGHLGDEVDDCALGEWHDNGKDWILSCMCREGDADMPMFRVGKRAAGRLLDGREWSEMPNA